MILCQAQCTVILPRAEISFLLCFYFGSRFPFYQGNYYDKYIRAIGDSLLLSRR